MSKETPLRGREQAEASKILKNLSRYRHNLWQVFQDMVALAALEISFAFDRRNIDKRVDEYKGIKSKYSEEEFNELSRCMAMVMSALENNPHDFLGQLYMSLELGNAWRGQFFTPDSVCQLMAEMSIDDRAQECITRYGFVSLSDPCVGAGAMIIAAANVLLQREVNYQECMYVVAQDVDITAVHMAYVQFSLLHIPAIVLHGNSLSMEVKSEWVTPAYCMGQWESKLKSRRMLDAFKALLAEGDAKDPVPDQVGQHEIVGIEQRPEAINIRQQMALF